MNTFVFASGYRLEVKKEGFCLYDEKTDELLIDASMIGTTSGWLAEMSISTTNRDFYIDTHNPLLGDKVDMGISVRK